MNLHPASIFLLFLCFLNTFSAATGDVSVNCGSSGISAAHSGKEWHGDIQPKFSSLIQMKGSSAASTVTHKSISADDPVPYRTARLSRSQFSHAFQVNPGQKILRLHFNPAPYKGFKKFKDLFDVEAGPFTLLSNFSASLTAYALGVNSFAKEFCINIQDNQQLNIVFSPASSQSLRTYAFINGIEIVSVPASLSYFQGKYIGVQVVGKSLVNVDNSTALEIIRRLNLKQDSVSSSGDIDDMFGMWETVPKRKESKMRSITWKTSVDVGFRYLVRLHFSELGLKMAEFSGITFKVCINDMIVDTNIDISRERDDEDIIPWYRDYMVVMMKGHKHEGKRDLLICLQSNGEFMDGHGLLKGFEIMKLSNSDNSLASPNSFPSTQDSSYRIFQNLHHVLGHRNMIATVAIALLALVNIIIYILRQIWEASCTEEENMPLVRAERLCRRFSLAEIQLATRNFSDAHLIGKGGFGKVYRGLIDNGRETVAIKRLKSNSNQGVREFLTEIETLTELRHVNLVSLIGYCNEYGEMILVYEYMECGTLADHLYKHSRKSDNCSSLTWEQRLNICIGAGRGLDYLHTGHSLIHRDVKPSNILLDENFIAKVSDFGLAKHLNRSTLQSHVSTKVKGTYGYLDPNYFTTGKLTRKSDTFSFGVVLLEVLSGRSAVDPWVAEDERMLTQWARENISKGKAEQIVASNLKGKISEDSLKAFVGVAERCLHDEPKERPTMAEVVLQLVSALKQQERESSKSTALKGITSDVDDIHSSNNESNSSVSTQQLTMASTDVQNLTPPQTNSKVVNTEPPSERKDWTKATTHKPSRLWTWDAFWSRIIPSGKNKHIREMSLRRRDLEQWMSHRCLPEELRRQIWEAERVNWAATRGVNEEMLMENLPEDLQRDIRRYLFNSFKTVRIFQFLDEHIIDAICERLRTKTYIKGSKIFYHGGLVDKMVFIFRGKMESIGEDLIVYLSEGDVCGEELLTWCLEQSSVNKDGRRIRIPGHRLLSNRLVRCLTNVEAFVLRAPDIEEVTSLFARFLRSPRVQGAIRYESPYWRGLAARQIQVAWRYRKKRQSRTGSSCPPHAYSS